MQSFFILEIRNTTSIEILQETHLSKTRLFIMEELKYIVH